MNDDEFLRLLAEDRAESAAPNDSKDSPSVSTNVRQLAIQALFRREWPAAARHVWSRARQIDALVIEDLEAAIWSGDRERSKAASLTLSDRLTALGHGDEALAALMLTADPQHPGSFRRILPNLAYEVEQVRDRKARTAATEHLRTWWEAARGEHKADSRSIFLIAWCEIEGSRDFRRRVKGPDIESLFDPHESEPDGPCIVVMPKARATRLGSNQLEFKDLIDARLPLAVARDLSGVRRTLIAEYPHSTAAIDLLLRDLRQDEPVRVKPILLCGPAGTGKSRLVRRIGDLLGVGVFRFDAAASSDNTFGGSPKAWSNTQPSAPARAINQTRIANPIVFVDEIEKAAVTEHNGRLWNAILPFLERETSARYRDVSLDAQLDLSWVSHIATANETKDLPAPLKDRYRVVRVPLPQLVDLPALAANVMGEIAAENGDITWPIDPDELEVIGRAWAMAGFSIRKLQKIVAATLETRNATAARH